MSLSRRRLVLASMLALGGIAVAADPARKSHRVAYLLYGSPTDGGGRPVENIRKAFRALGYSDGPGGNLVIDIRWAEGDPGRYPALAAELTALKPDVFMAATFTAIDAVRRAAPSTPIVISTADPVGAGLVQSLARPGGNITGLSTVESDLNPKTLQIIHAIVPAATRMAYLMRDSPQLRARLKELQDAAKSLGVSVDGVTANSPPEIESAFATMARNKIGELIVSSDTMPVEKRKQIIDLAAKARLPAIYYDKSFVEQGGLVSYGPDRSRQVELMVGYVDKILRGAKPADLPVQQLDKFELVINQKTAKALGIRIPQELLVGAVVI